MDPVTIGILGSAVVGGISQFMNSQAANGANAAEIQQLQGLVNKIQQPNFNPASLTPQDYAVVGKYAPQVAQHVQEMNPTLINQGSAAISQGQQAASEAGRQFV